MIAVIIPTLNEEASIKEVIEAFPESFQDEEIEIFVIDGGSTDSTVNIAEETRAEVMHQRLGGGKGNGVREAIEKIEANIYVLIDGDRTYDPAEIDKLLKPILDGEAEHVIGARKNRDKGAIPRLNLIGNKLFNLVIRTSTGENVTDMLSGYRAFTAESLRYTDFTRPGFGIETEMTITALENHVPLVEVPITYKHRKGESKLHPVKDGFRIVKTIIWSIRDLYPLKFFSAVSLGLLVLSFYPAYITIQQKLQNGVITNPAPVVFVSVLVILALQLLIFGLLADQIKNMETRLRNQLD